MFQKTTAQIKIARLRKRVRVVQGGSSSSKTFSIIPMLITYAIQKPLQEISVVSESIPHLRRGAIRDFIKIMGWTGNLNESQWNKSTLTYTFTNGSFIEFFSADQPDKMRGARRDVLFVNEANNIDWESYHQLAIRTRKFIYIDYNPTAEFWAHTELIGYDDTDFIILTYRDNEALEESIIKEFERAIEKAKTSEYWANWCKVYIEGQVGSLQGVIFNNWKQIDTIPDEAKLMAYGLDFGYTNDPTALIGIYYMDGKYYLDEIVYQKELTNSDLSNIMKSKGVDAKVNIYADSAEPKSISDLRRLGWRVKPAVKGTDSIKFGIQVMLEHEFFVTSRSIYLIKELRHYVWDSKKKDKPIDAFNHALDGVRYYFQTERAKPKSKHYAI